MASPLLNTSHDGRGLKLSKVKRYMRLSFYGGLVASLFLPNVRSFGQAFGESLDDLDASRRNLFIEGFRSFTQVWPGDPAVVRRLNGNSCVVCHSEPMPGGSGTADRSFVHVQPRSEGPRIYPSFEQRPGYKPLKLAFPPGSSSRKAPALFGLGLLEEAVLSQVPLVSCGAVGAGRFGWNANFATIDDIVRRAFELELGLQVQQVPRGMEKLPSENDVRTVADFIRFLAPPPPRAKSEVAIAGERVFDRVGCIRCHSATLTTKPTANPALSEKTIHPYSDLRVHNLTESPVGDVNCGSVLIRTAPLWGLASTGPPFLHDGSAESIAAAIEAHDGEARWERSIYRSLTSTEKKQLLVFLNSL